MPSCSTAPGSDADGDGIGDNLEFRDFDGVQRRRGLLGPLGRHSDGDGWSTPPMIGARTVNARVRTPSRTIPRNGVTRRRGYGDTESGNRPMHAPTKRGPRTVTCSDAPTDGDGWSNAGEPFRTTAPSGRTATVTTVATTPTATTPTCTLTIGQWADSDGDGYGDNPSGMNGDRFPNDALQWEDTDGDGFGDNFVDEDGDGVSDQVTSAQRLQAVQGPAKPRLPGQRR